VSAVRANFEEFMMSDKPFTDGKTIIGFNLLKMIYWFAESEGIQGPQKAHKDSLSFHGWPKIMLPPVQRSAVWRPKQVVDLWDSVMRGLPIGMFYLTRQEAGQHFGTTLTGNTREEVLPDVSYALLDGQQRIRALLLGIVGFSEEKRCLWVDLGNEEASRHPVLRITSKGQPFGYDTNTGNKFSLEERKAARRKLEKDGEILYKDGTRSAYDQELFDDKDITQNGRPIQPRPPLPYRASEYTFKLFELLHAWQEGEAHSVDEGVAGLRAFTKSGPSEDTLVCLHKAFEKIEKAEVALLRVDPKNFLNEREDLLE
jgi:hypothetical protein